MIFVLFHGDFVSSFRFVISSNTLRTWIPAGKTIVRPLHDYVEASKHTLSSRYFVESRFSF